ncbi:hypothetical protein ACFL4X_02575 [Gemmatimonadota bacterium]
MKKQLLNILIAITLLFFVLFVVFVINQTASVVVLAKDYSPNFGSVLLYGLLLIYAVLFLFPIIYILTMPSTLRPGIKTAVPRAVVILPRGFAILTFRKQIADTPLLSTGNTGDTARSG